MAEPTRQPLPLRAARMLRLRQPGAPRVEITTHELDDLPCLRFHLQEEPDAPRVVLALDEPRLQGRVVLGDHAVPRAAARSASSCGTNRSSPSGSWPR